MLNVWKTKKKKKKQVFNISGINLQCFAESIHAFCEEHCRVLDFTILASRQHGTIAARLVVPADESHLVESESIAQPRHIYICGWKFETEWGYFLAVEAQLSSLSNGRIGKAKIERTKKIKKQMTKNIKTIPTGRYLYYSFNSRSIRNKIVEISDSHILAVSETWLAPSMSNSLMSANTSATV